MHLQYSILRMIPPGHMASEVEGHLQTSSQSVMDSHLITTSSVGNKEFQKIHVWLVTYQKKVMNVLGVLP